LKKKTNSVAGIALSMAIFSPCISMAGDQLDTLARDPAWLKLLHYENISLFGATAKSVIHSGDFFFAPDGKTNPRNELEATLRAMNSPVMPPDQHPRCRFPARIGWLEKNFGKKTEFDIEAECPAYFKWISKGTTTSISVVFANGYLGNPASYYGHTLLKFNNQQSGFSNNLLDATVNYGAIMEKKDDPVTYIFKGVFGGYEAGFSDVDFYFHNHNYGENELRDLWEYKLDLPQEDVDLVVNHAWEVMGKKYTYYFFRENCAYRMAEIIQVLDGIEIIPGNRLWTVPQSLVKKLTDAERDGQKLVSKIIYHPSRQSRFYARHNDLKHEEKELLQDIVLHQIELDNEKFTRRSLTSKHKLLDATLDYYRFTNGYSREHQAYNLDPDYIAALNARFELPAGSTEVAGRDPASPHLGRSPSWTQLGLVSNSHAGDAISLRIRPAYYDALDSDSGHVRNAALGMGDIQFYAKNGRIRLNKLDLIAIDSVNPGISGLPDDSGLAWKIRAGGEQAKISCTDCLLARAQGDIGYGRQVSKNLFAAAYLGGGAQEMRHDQDIGFARATLDLIARWGVNLSTKASLESRRSLNENQVTTYRRANVRWEINNQFDLRFSYEHGDARALGFGVGLYW
jgi:hypothetical protein